MPVLYVGLTYSKTYHYWADFAQVQAQTETSRKPEFFGKTPPSSAYCRSNFQLSPVSIAPPPPSSSPPLRADETLLRAPKPSPPPPPASAVAMYADRSSGRKRSVRDRLGSGGGSRSRSEDAKRCVLELARFKSSLVPPLPCSLALHVCGFCLDR